LDKRLKNDKQMKRNFVLFLAVIGLLACNSVQKTPIDHNATKETVSLYNHLFQLLDKGIMLGHQDALAYGHAWYKEDSRSDVKDVTGDYPAVIGFELGHLEHGAAYNLDSVYFTDMKRYAQQTQARGGILTFSWHGDNIVTGGTAWDCAQDSVVCSVLPGGANHAKFLTWLDRLADFFTDLRDENGVAIPVMFRMYHEHSGAWFWWGSAQCTPEEYIRLWRMTVEYLRDTKNVHNMLYSFSPSEINDEAHYLERYPGDDYVDVVGFDCYANGEREDQNEEKTRQQIERYKTVMAHNLDIVTTYAAKAGKLSTISETGMERFPYPTYFSDVVYNTIKPYKVSYVLFWRNAWERPTHYYLPYLGHPAVQDFVDFVSQPDILLNEAMK
jgi:mannan endo-1,4-beta-mannosidase